MKRTHAAIAAGVMGVAAVAGTVAVTKTTHAGALAVKPIRLPAAEVVRRQQALDQLESQVRAALRAKVPALPALPSYAPVPVPVPVPVPNRRELSAVPVAGHEAATVAAAPAPVHAPAPARPAAARPVASSLASASPGVVAPRPALSVAVVPQKPVIETRTSPAAGGTAGSPASYDEGDGTGDHGSGGGDGYGGSDD